MDFKDMDKTARGTGHLPDGLNLTEATCFSSLRGLYGTYRGGGIGREDAAKEKKAIRAAECQAAEDNSRRYAVYCQAEMRRHALIKGARDRKEETK